MLRATLLGVAPLDGAPLPGAASRLDGAKVVGVVSRVVRRWAGLIDAIRPTAWATGGAVSR
jgi:hypothetical protein